MVKVAPLTVFQERVLDADPRRLDSRDSYERDRSRIIHSAAFRRLQAKTQVLGISEGDFHRTRLTHSMEVAQICRGLVMKLEKSGEDFVEYLPPVHLIEAIGLAHDLGHPPFGHGGEVALNHVMHKHGGFEGNAQTLRLLSRLESHTPEHGLNLTRRMLLGILKYPVPYSRITKLRYPEVTHPTENLKDVEWYPPKCYFNDEADIVSWILDPFSNHDHSHFTVLSSEPSDSAHGKSMHKALDTTIMDIADEIAYGTHDLEDGIVLNQITGDHWVEYIENKIDNRWLNEMLPDVKDKLFGKFSKYGGCDRKQAVGAVVNLLISGGIINEEKGFQHPLLKYRMTLEEPYILFLNALNKLTWDCLINLHTVKTLEFRGQRLVTSLFDAINTDPQRLLKPSDRKTYEHFGDETSKMRVICDFIAGMTDEYATKMYERLFLPRHGTIFEKL